MIECMILVRASAVSLLLLAAAAAPSADEISARARKLHFGSIVLDTHDDTTERLFSTEYDLGKRNASGHIDIPRMREGGMNAIFFSIWIDGRIMGSAAVQKALDQMDAVRQNVSRFPKDIVFARTAAEVRRATQEGRIAALMGVEGGHMMGNDLRILRTFAALGVRYMTLSHFYNNEWADSSTDKPVHNGLSDFGKDVIREMNRQGMMVDISHVGDKTFFDALEISKAPLIASHSSCRALCDHPRNMTDEMIKALAAKGGVIQINYERSFLDQEYKEAYDKATGGVVANLGRIAKQCNNDETCMVKALGEQRKQLTAEGKLPHVSWRRIVDHIDHAVKVAGADHVGLGSDFDGADMPEGMDDCSQLPKITQALIDKGYSDADIRKILGENTLRAMEQAERAAREMNASH